MACHGAKLHKICLLSDLTAVVLFWFSKKTFPEFVVRHKQNHGAYQSPAHKQPIISAVTSERWLCEVGGFARCAARS